MKIGAYQLDRDLMKTALSGLRSSPIVEYRVDYKNRDAATIEEGDWWAWGRDGMDNEIMTEHHAGPDHALFALAVRAFCGGFCLHCERFIIMPEHLVVEIEDVWIVGGEPWTADEIIAAGTCHWRRKDNRFVSECGIRTE